MYWTSPRTPCSGPKSAPSVTPGAAHSRSARCRKRPSTLVGLTMAPTRSPRSARNCSASQTSSPVLTRLTRGSVPRPALGSTPGRAERAHRLLLRLERLEERGLLLLPPRPAVEVSQGPGDHHVLRLCPVKVREGLLGLRGLRRPLLDGGELELEPGVPIARADEVAKLLLGLAPVSGPLRQRRQAAVRIQVVAPEGD